MLRHPPTHSTRCSACRIVNCTENIMILHSCFSLLPSAMATLLPLLLLLSTTVVSLSSASGPKEHKGKEHHERWKESPYFFDKESFRQWGGTQHGNLRVLEPFSKRSELLRGIEDYRFAVMEAEPSTFLLPSHFDAKEVFYVTQGRGSITLLCENEKESYDIEKGDIMVIPSGTVVYGTNSDPNEKLRIALLLQTISAPGQFEEFFGAGGKKPQSFYRSFSTEVLEAIFNSDRVTIEKVFSHEKGSIVRASQEQIRDLKQSSSSYPGGEGGSSEGSSTGGGEGVPWRIRRYDEPPRPSERSRKPFNLLQKNPSHANEYGKLFEVDQSDYRPLREMNVDVSLANISKGSMAAPSYNTEAIKLAFVVDGNGYFEMVRPQLSKKDEDSMANKKEKEKEEKKHSREEEEEEEQEEGRRGYRRVRAEASPGSLFVIPPGHPVVVVASGDSKLEVLCFGINAGNNRKQYLGGRNNVLRLMERAAKELSFGASAEEVDRFLDAQPTGVFLPGPERRRRGDGGGVATLF